MNETPPLNNGKAFERSSEDQNRKVAAEMQIELARRFYGLGEDADRGELNDIVLRWVTQNDMSNSRKFREFVEAHPEVVELFKKDPEAALKKIEENIYESQHS